MTLPALVPARSDEIQLVSDNARFEQLMGSGILTAWIPTLHTVPVLLRWSTFQRALAGREAEAVSPVLRQKFGFWGLYPESPIPL